MDIALLAIGMILLVLLSAVAVGLVVFELPGTLLILTLATIFAILDRQIAGDGIVGYGTLIVLGLLFVTGEWLDAQAGRLPKGDAGQGPYPVIYMVIGALIGGLAGAFLLQPVYGAIMGGIIGGGTGHGWGRTKRLAARLQSAGQPQKTGLAIGRLWGVAVKFVIAGLMWFVVVLAVIWP